jgi:hypothetical protein
MAIKVLMAWGFSQTGPYRPGVSEVLYYLGAATTTQDTALNQAVVSLMNARTNLMGNNVTALLYRLSVPNVPHSTNTVFATPQPNGNSPIQQTPAISWGGSDVPNTSLKITAKSGQAQPRNMYLAGLPDALLQTNPVGPNWSAAGLAGFQNYWNIWSSIILNGQWGTNFLNRLPAGQPVNIAYWQQSTVAPFNLQFAIPTTSGYQPSVGSIVHIRKVLMGVTGVPRPLGRWKIKSTSADGSGNNLYELDQSSAYQAVLIQQAGTVESVTFGYQPFVSLSNYLQTSRRRGIGPVRPRGRSKPRLRRQAS